MSTLVNHWRRLAGSVHPDDASHLAAHTHTFNLDYPPPAYIGDVDNAPVVLLMMNGGYNPRLTPAEFPDEAAIERYLEMLHNPKPVNPSDVSPYYNAGAYGRHIASGRLVLVNAVPYRSPGLSRERESKWLANRLPSTLLHRRWLREELIPQALAGDRTIIAHRHAMWKLNRDEHDHRNIVFTTNPISPYPTAALMDTLLVG